MNKPEYVVIHHSLTEDGLTVNWDAIRKYHVETNGWSDIGYHFGVERVNGVLTTQMGRRVDLEGAHTKEMNMNARSIGICVVGNFDVAPPDWATVNYLRDLIYAITANYPIPVQNVLGHRDVGLMAGFDWRKIGSTGVREYKTCPGILFPLHGLQIELKGVL
jgi:N-acetyl-anhydromuramyl-L-alanine amidase AmpD